MKGSFQCFTILAIAVTQNHYGGSALGMETPSSVVLADYSSATASLFNNMRTPASIIAGAMVPVGLLSPLAIQPQENDGRVEIFLRKSYPFFAVVALCSQLLSVMWATVAVNQLTEAKHVLTTNVWQLIQQDFQIEWVATNAHFVLGMMGFMWVIGTRAYFVANGGRLGTSVAGLVFSCFLLLTSIGNRGVAAGGGAGLQYGTNISALFYTYGRLLIKRACAPKTFGPLELGAMAIALVSTISGVLVVISKDKPDMDQKEKSTRLLTTGRRNNTAR